MLSRTADNLYWLSRYVERAEFVARILDAAHRLAALPSSYGGGETNEWASALASAGDPEVFKPLYDGVTEATNPEGRMFGMSQLDHALERCHEDAHHLIASVLATLNDFTAGAPPEDDRTLLVARVG